MDNTPSVKKLNDFIEFINRQRPRNGNPMIPENDMNIWSTIPKQIRDLTNRDTEYYDIQNKLNQKTQEVDTVNGEKQTLKTEETRLKKELQNLINFQQNANKHSETAESEMDQIDPRHLEYIAKFILRISSTVGREAVDTSQSELWHQIQQGIRKLVGMDQKLKDELAECDSKAADLQEKLNKAEDEASALREAQTTADSEQNELEKKNEELKRTLQQAQDELKKANNKMEQDAATMKKKGLSQSPDVSVVDSGPASKMWDMAFDKIEKGQKRTQKEVDSREREGSYSDTGNGER